jgi:hypothetical protein
MLAADYGSFDNACDVLRRSLALVCFTLVAAIAVSVGFLATGASGSAVRESRCGWREVSLSIAVGSALVDVVAFAPDDAWTVGMQGPEMVDQSRLFMMHWNGNGWRLAAPAIHVPGFLAAAMAGTSGRDLWIVGHNSADNQSQILHWDGRELRLVGNPGKDRVYDVVALSTDDAWAVGRIALHWDGRRWRQVKAAPEGTELASVSGRESNDVWAVGARIANSPPIATIVRWNGNKWLPIPKQSPPLVASGLNDVSIARDGTLWAVGGTSGISDHGEPPAAGWAIGYRRDGAHLHLDRSPSLRRIGALDSVLVRSRRDGWALGGSVGNPLFLRWEGHTWRRTTTPSFLRRAETTIDGLAAAPQGPVWGVGYYWDKQHEQSRPLAVRNDC